MLKQEIIITNKLGLHARASSKFTQVASQFKSEIWVMRNEKRANGKSIMALMMLAANKGSTIKLEIFGSDQQDAMNALTKLINNHFGESE